MGTVLVQLTLFLTVLTVIALFLGEYMAKVFKGEKTFFSFILRPLEKLIYKLFGVDETKETGWKTYIFSLVIFNLICIISLFVLQEVQHLLPLNPQGFGALRWDTALNTAVSFGTNTNWQAYSGEQTMSYLTQMLGLTVQNFLSAAIGIAAAIAFLRAFMRKEVTKLGNFWVDLTRSIVYILLPLSILFSVVFVSQGMIQNLNPYVKVQTLQGQEQVIAQGPVASQEAIKELGTNGGGFFNSNSSHPYENPTPLTDYMEILGMLIIAAALPFTFGALLNNRKQGWAIFASMMILYLIGLSVALWAEFHGNPFLSKLGIEYGLNMEGKEVRFGILNSVVFGQSTTVTSCGAINAMHDSLMPLTGLVLMFNMMIGEVIFGGVGTGLIGMVLYAIITMFLVGLMIGRTPEIFGKKLEPFEMIMAVIAVILPSIIQLVFGAVASTHNIGLSSLNNTGPHGLSEIIYAFASGAGNNGSAFAGLNANTPFYNLTLAFAMLIGRFGTIIPSLAIAGSLIQKKFVPEEAKFPTTGPLFVVMLVSVLIIVGALTFFPVLVLGPILDHLLMQTAVLF
ncbi:MAG: potassium-transporting ATPase subunit KdpA [Candidatus Gastranaerophilaceae bacterium]|jgi:K+-transporting ATPase ATPase A chain